MDRSSGIAVRQSVELLEKNKPLRAAWSAEVVDSFIKLKMQDWSAYTAHLSEWERQNTLDC